MYLTEALAYQEKEQVLKQPIPPDGVAVGRLLLIKWSGFFSVISPKLNMDIQCGLHV